MNLHLYLLKFLLLVCEIIPGNWAIDLTISKDFELFGEIERRALIVLDLRERSLDQAQFQQTFPTLIPDGIPAGFVAISYPFNIFRQGMQGKVWCSKGHIGKERFVSMMGLMLLQYLDHMIRHGGCRIKPILGFYSLAILEKVSLASHKCLKLT